MSGHRIIADIDYISAYLFESTTVAPAELVPPVDRTSLPASPPSSFGTTALPR